MFNTYLVIYNTYASPKLNRIHWSVTLLISSKYLKHICIIIVPYIITTKRLSDDCQTTLTYAFFFFFCFYSIFFRLYFRCRSSCHRTWPRWRWFAFCTWACWLACGRVRPAASHRLNRGELRWLYTNITHTPRARVDETSEQQREKKTKFVEFWWLWNWNWNFEPAGTWLVWLCVCLFTWHTHPHTHTEGQTNREKHTHTLG